MHLKKNTWPLFLVNLTDSFHFQASLELADMGESCSPKSPFHLTKIPRFQRMFGRG